MDIVALVLALAALGVGVLALRRADVVERRARRWAPDSSGGEAATGGAAAAAADRSGAASADRSEVAGLRRRVEDLAAGAPDAAAAASGLSRVAVVRYDAFEDLGGRLSFSAAVLDDRGTGFVLTAIHGRSETRSYLKQVPPPDGEGGQRELSPEEKQAIREAMRDRRS